MTSSVAAKREIAVFGGSFDPPHFGHIAVADAVVREGIADEVWMMVSPLNPLKKDKEISPDGIRLEMTRAAVARASLYPENVKVSDFEFSLPRPSYSYSTLQALEREYPDCRFSIIIGADNASLFYKWKDSDKIISEFGVIIYPRPDYEIPRVMQNCRILTGVRLMPVSSSQIRSLAKEKKDITPYLPPDVAEIIKRYGLYGK